MALTQFGFRCHHSCIDALLAIFKTIAETLNQNRKCVIIVLDLKKAFDLLDHDLFLDKLLKYGFSEVSIKWFRSFLCNRYQFVRFKTYFQPYNLRTSE